MVNVIKYVILKIALIDAPEMSFLSKQAKKNFENFERENRGEECFPVIEMCRNWARLMEKEISMGNFLDDKTIKACEELAASGVRHYDEGYPAWAKRILLNHWAYGHLLQDYQ